MEQHNTDRYITIKPQTEFISKRNCFTRKWYLSEIFTLIEAPFYSYNSDKTIVLNGSSLYSVIKWITINYFSRSIKTERNLIILPAKYYISNRNLICFISGLKSLNTTKLILPFSYFCEKYLYFEGADISQRFIYLNKYDVYNSEKYIKIARNIFIDVNETDLLLPFKYSNKITCYVDIGYKSQRYIQFCFEKTSNRDIYLQVNKETSINETELQLPYKSYTELNLYLVGLSKSERFISLKLNRIITDKIIKLKKYYIKNDEKICNIKVLRAISVNETDLVMAYLKWSDRFIDAPAIVYNAERKIWIPTSIQNIYIARTPLDICVNVKDLVKVIDGFFYVGIESMVIKDENNILLTYLTEEDYEKGIVKTKIKNIFNDNKQIKRLRFEIFTIQGKQLNNKKKKLLFTGYFKGKIMK